jgi:hypothetical protein
VVLPEEPQDLLVARHGRVEDDEYDLGVSRPAAADLLVRRVGREAARVAGRRRVHARRLPEDTLRTPEAAHADDGALEALGERRFERRAEDVVPLGNRQALVATGERVGGVDGAGLVEEPREHPPQA